MLNVEIINNSPFPLPSYQTPGAAGMDLYANLHLPLTLHPMERSLVPTGIAIALPPGFEAQVRPRSGLALRKGITCLNTPGTIDSDYRGEIRVILVNLSKEIQEIHPGDRIAQLVVSRVETVQWQIAALLTESDRGPGGFGSTGS